jgi:hypothetical protein
MIISGIVGLDLSLTGTGMARISKEDDDDMETHLLGSKASEGTRMQRYIQIARQILHRSTKSDLFIIEDYAFGIASKASQLATLGELGGIVKFFITQTTGNEPLTITTGEMRKFISGKGNLKKDMIPVHAYKRYKVEDVSHDEYVAMILADMGDHLVSSEPQHGGLNKQQAEIIDKLRKKYIKELKAISEKNFKRAK